MREDADLLAAWATGDRAAAAELIERHYDAVVGFFRTKAGPEAEDLVQRTFLRCAEAASTFRGDGTYRGFLFGIARNVLFEHIRDRSRHGQVPIDFNTSSIFDLRPGIATLASQHAEREVLVAALQRIPVELQLAIELHYWQELSIDELAAALGVPPGTVKSRLHRARALLREAMESLPSSSETKASVRAKLAAWGE